MSIAVVTFPGSNCDHDVAYVVTHLLHRQALRVWHTDSALPAGTRAVVLPGGFSYGDYLRAGAMAAQAPVMAAIRAAARQGMPILGICNGFQILCEAGLLPGALLPNQGLNFICEEAELHIEHADTPFTQGLQGQTLTLPIAHGQGRYYADAATLQTLTAQRQIILRYGGANPNGSVEAIAGVCNAQRNVLGLMPHPERAAERALGRSDDGLGLFNSLLQHIAHSEHIERSAS